MCTICVSIGNVTVAECLDIIAGSKLAEIRLDLLDLSDSDIERVFSSSKELIATSKDNNVALLKKAIDAGAKYIDIDVDTPVSKRQELIKYVRSNNRLLIVSYHNCECTPEDSELNAIVQRCLELKPDVVKLACVSRSTRDNLRLMSLLKTELPMVVIGMGSTGRITRFVAPLLGSLWTYASISNNLQTAFGQVTKQELEDFFNICR